MSAILCTTLSADNDGDRRICITVTGAIFQIISCVWVENATLIVLWPLFAESLSRRREFLLASSTIRPTSEIQGERRDPRRQAALRKDGEAPCLERWDLSSEGGVI